MLICRFDMIVFWYDRVWSCVIAGSDSDRSRLPSYDYGYDRESDTEREREQVSRTRWWPWEQRGYGDYLCYSVPFTPRWADLWMTRLGNSDLSITSALALLFLKLIRRNAIYFNNITYYHKSYYHKINTDFSIAKAIKIYYFSPHVIC